MPECWYASFGDAIPFGERRCQRAQSGSAFSNSSPDFKDDLSEHFRLPLVNTLIS